MLDFPTNFNSFKPYLLRSHTVWNISLLIRSRKNEICYFWRSRQHKLFYLWRFRQKNVCHLWRCRQKKNMFVIYDALVIICVSCIRVQGVGCILCLVGITYLFLLYYNSLQNFVLLLICYISIISSCNVWYKVPFPKENLVLFCAEKFSSVFVKISRFFKS